MVSLSSLISVPLRRSKEEVTQLPNETSGSSFVAGVVGAGASSTFAGSTHSPFGARSLMRQTNLGRCEGSLNLAKEEHHEEAGPVAVAFFARGPRRASRRLRAKAVGERRAVRGAATRLGAGKTTLLLAFAQAIPRATTRP